MYLSLFFLFFFIDIMTAGILKTVQKSEIFFYLFTLF